MENFREMRKSNIRNTCSLPETSKALDHLTIEGANDTYNLYLASCIGQSALNVSVVADAFGELSGENLEFGI